MIRLLPDSPRLRWAALAGYALLALVLIAVLVVAAFPLGMFKGTLERRMSDRFGRPVTIAAIERQDAFSLTPTIAIRGVRVPQPDWAGAGDLARIDRAEVRFPILPLIVGRFEPQAITLSGARIALVRAKDGRENWHGKGRDRRSRRTPTIERLTIADTRLSYRDAKQDRTFVLNVAADGTGLRADGRGVVRGAAVDVTIRGAAIGKDTANPWPFRAALDGPDLAIAATGTMAAPLDTNHMTLDITARAADLKLIDAVIEAGLFRTQPVSLKAHVVRERPKWTITGLTGTIGRSTIAGRLTVDKVDRRSKVDGEIVSTQLDFSDLASSEGLAEAAAKERAIGPRVVPDSRIDIGKIDRTDGRIAFRIDRIVSREGPSSIRNARGVITMDRQLLTIAPLRMDATQGYIAGRAVIDQRGGAKMPTATFDLRLTGSSIGALAGGGGSVTGRVDARALLTGRGTTIRQAVANSSGRIGLAARDGSLPDRFAVALGFDAGRALFASNEDRAGLRCVIFGATLKNGQGVVGPMIVDTTQSKLTGSGSIRFPQETLGIRLTGSPKHHALLRLPGSAIMSGTLSQPDIVVPPEVKSVGNIFKAIGRAIKGTQGPVATDADCRALAAKVLR